MFYSHQHMYFFIRLLSSLCVISHAQQDEKHFWLIEVMLRGVNRFTDQQIWLNKNARLLDIEDIYFRDWLILNVNQITNFFDMSVWIMDFDCVEVL